MNLNQLQNIQFEMQIERLKGFTFNLNKVSIPSISIAPPEQTSPFKNIARVGDTPIFANLNATVIMDEDLESWLSLYDWITYSNPDNFNQFENSKFDGFHESDIAITIMKNSKNPLMKFNFINCVPINMSEINLDTSQTESQSFDFNVEFTYDSFMPVRSI